MRGFMGPERSIGGLPRTFGLQRQETEGPKPVRKWTRKDYARLLCYLKPYTWRWIVIFACVATSAGLAVVPPLLVRGILDEAIPHANHELLYALVGAIVGLTIVTGLIGVLQTSATAQVGQSIMFDLRTQLYRQLQRMSLHFYTTNRSGEIVSRISNDAGALQGFATGTVIESVRNLLGVIATVVTMLLMNWQLSLLAFALVPVFILPTRFVGRIRRRLSGRTQESQAALQAFMQERLNVSGALLTKTFGQADPDAETFEARAAEIRELNVKQTMVGRWLFMVLSTISVAGPAMIYLYGGSLVMGSVISIGTLIAFNAYLTNLYRPMAQLSNIYVDFQGGLAVCERIFEYLDLTPEVEDRPDARPLPRTEGHIRFEGVRFAYPKASNGNGRDPGDEDPVEPRPALEDVSFEILPGQRAALVGPSGAGKTTITYLLPRFFDPAEGTIRLDGIDVRDLRQDDLRAHIGVVMQDTFLFHASVRENLLYARPGATEEEIVAATRAANIHEFIECLPEGYETVVGERGFRLSGGEKQRLSIARALLKNPRILVLDEATSNLDATSEHLVQQALTKLLEGRTALIIAHRLSTILHTDTILVLDRGRLVESGPHPELLARGGLYATLYLTQFARVVGRAGEPAAL